MKFITPTTIEEHLSLEDIAMDINLLLQGKVQMNTLHNHSTQALLNEDLDMYLSKALVKAYYKFITKHGV